MKRRVIAVVLVASILCSLHASVFASEQNSRIVPDYEEYCYFVDNMDEKDFNPEIRLYLLSLDAFSKWEDLIELASGLIKEDLSVERCTEILANMATLMNYQLEDAIVEQASIDTTKTLLDYGVDLAGIIAGEIGAKTLQKSADAVVKRIATIAGITDGFKGFVVDTIDELELIVQLEGDYMMQYDFLETVSMYSDIPEMREAAQSLMLANNKIMEYKLDTIASVGGSFAKFEAHDVFLDQVAGELFEDPDFLDTETFPLLAIAKVYEYYSAAKLAFDITLFFGNTLFGTSDIYNRFNEMIAMRDIRNALLSRVKANPALHEEDYDNMDRNISFMKMALYVDVRGEYCVYKMVTEEGKLSKLFSSSNGKSVEENYELSLDIIQNTLSILQSIYRTKDMMQAEVRYQEYDKDEQYKLNVFLSNFSEQWFHETCSTKFQAKNADLMELIEFACLYLKLNDNEKIEFITHNGYSYATVSIDRLNSVIERFFGRKVSLSDIVSRKISDDFYDYIILNDLVCFAWGDGETYNNLTISKNIQDLNDGTLQVEFNIYSIEIGNTDLVDIGGGIKDRSLYYYNCKEADTHLDFVFHKSGVAIIKPYTTSTGKETYQLLSYELFPFFESIDNSST